MHSCTLTYKRAATARIILDKLIITGCDINDGISTEGSYRVSGRQANESAAHGRGRTRRLNRWRFISVLLQSSSSVICWQSHPISCHRSDKAEEVFPHKNRNCKYEQNSVEAECFLGSVKFCRWFCVSNLFFCRQNESERVLKILAALQVVFVELVGFLVRRGTLGLIIRNISSWKTVLSQLRNSLKVFSNLLFVL